LLINILLIKIIDHFKSRELEPVNDNLKANSFNQNNSNTDSSATNQAQSSNSNLLSIQPKHDLEFNVWTKADCEDTGAFPNGNRY
jgi:hypothetical protein